MLISQYKYNFFLCVCVFHSILKLPLKPDFFSISYSKSGLLNAFRFFLLLSVSIANLFQNGIKPNELTKKKYKIGTKLLLD